MADSEVDRWKYWSRLSKTLVERTIVPWRHPSFVLYFLVAVVLVGGAGVWLELHNLIFPVTEIPQPYSALRTAIVTFFPALAGSSCMQIILEENDDRALRALAVCVLILLSTLALAIAPASVSSCFALALGGIGTLAALWTWWIANAKQPSLQDDRPDAAIGKSDPKSGLSGSLEGFNA